jgi:hypothetical protein
MDEAEHYLDTVPDKVSWFLCDYTESFPLTQRQRFCWTPSQRETEWQTKRAIFAVAPSIKLPWVIEFLASS